QLTPGTLRTQCKVLSLSPTRHGHWQLYVMNGGNNRLAHEKLLAKAVVLAVPAAAAAQLLAPFASSAAQILAQIPYAPIASVALGYARDRVGHPLDGFGFLVPRRERVPLLGALFSSTLFAERAAADQVLLTAFIGGTTNPAILEKTDSILLRQVEGDLAHCLRTTAPADFVYLTRYTAAIPQYTLGHLDRLQQLDTQLAPFAGLYLRANWRDGVSVADCVRNGERLATQIASHYATLSDGSAEQKQGG
ncbi:MAG: protoporphyrinogen oxidase, partial [Magnetococcales bacterium]|nr:protoporphyrinogen oxidase [Magnetococcales bacterium]